MNRSNNFDKIVEKWGYGDAIETKEINLDDEILQDQYKKEIDYLYINVT